MATIVKTIFISLYMLFMVTYITKIFYFILNHRVLVRTQNNTYLLILLAYIHTGQGTEHIMPPTFYK